MFNVKGSTVFCGRTDQSSIVSSVFEYIILAAVRRVESEPSVDFLSLLVQSRLCWFQHVDAPFPVAQKLAYLWSAHHCKSAHQVLSVSPSKAGHQQTAASSCNCAIFAGVFYLNRSTNQKLESLFNSRPTCWSFSPFTGSKGHMFAWKSKREHDIIYLLNDSNMHLPHTRWPSLPLCFCQAPAPTLSLFLSFILF